MPAKRTKTRKKRNVLHHIHRQARDHFIPHDGNNHIPHVLRHRVLFGYAVLLILLKIFVVVAAISLPASSLYSSAITPQNIIDLTNQTRRNLGLPELKTNPLLTQAAQAKANDMATLGYFAHTSPSGATPWSWIRNAGYLYRSAGENLAVHFDTAEAVNSGWLASPTHRANIVSDRYSEIGIGIAMGEYEGVPSTFVTQMFGYPAARETAEPVAAGTEPAPAPEPRAPTPAAPAPALAPQPAPLVSEPAPGNVAAAQIPAPAPAPAAPPADWSATIDESNVSIVQEPNVYQVRVTVHDATSVAASLGLEWTPLTRDGASNVYTGALAYAPEHMATTGEALRIVATGKDGKQRVHTVAIAAPQTTTQDLYAFSEGGKKTAKILGFLNLQQLDDKVRTFYIYSILFLGTVLLINILVKIRVQHPKIIGHALFIVVLALFLTLF